MRRIIVFVAVLAFVTAACSTSVQNTSKEKPEEQQTTIVREDNGSSPDTSVNTTEENLSNTTKTPEGDPLDVTEKDDSSVSPASSQETPCSVLLNTTKDLDGMVQERIDCLNWLEKSFNSTYTPTVVMLSHKLYYEGPIDQDPILPKISGNLTSVTYILAVSGSSDDATIQVDRAVFNLIQGTYILSDKLGVEEIYIRSYFSSETYIDIYVTIETLRNISKGSTVQDVFNALTITLVINGEEQSIEKPESATEPDTP